MFLLLNLLGFICALSLLVPTTFLPVYVKWPVAFGVVILLTAIFNTKKKDTLYLTKTIKSVSVKRGLFHPLMNYTAYALLLTAFLSIFEITKVNGINDLITDFSKIVNLITGFDKLMVCSLALIVIAFLVSAIFKWVLSSCADTTTLKERGFLYVVLTITTSVSLIYAALSCDVVGFNDFILAGNNLYVFFGVAGLFVLIDFIICLVSLCKRRKAKKLASLPVEMRPVKKTRAEKRSEKKAKKYAKAVRVFEKELAKKQAKLDKKIAKLNKKIQKKNAKLDKKISKKAAKKAAKAAKKQAKLDAKAAKKTAKKGQAIPAEEAQVQE